MSSTSAGFQAETTCRRLEGLAFRPSTSFAIWSMERPSGAAQLRHWWP